MENPAKESMGQTESRPGRITGYVLDQQTRTPFVNVPVALVEGDHKELPADCGHTVIYTNNDGHFCFDDVAAGKYTIVADALGLQRMAVRTVKAGCMADPVVIEIPLNVTMRISSADDCGGPKHCERAIVNHPMILSLDFNRELAASIDQIVFESAPGVMFTPLGPRGDMVEARFSQPGMYSLWGQFRGKLSTVLPPFGAATPVGPMARFGFTTTASSPAPQTVAGNLGVTLRRTSSKPTPDQALWIAIRNRTRAISFNAFREFVDRVFCVSNTVQPSDPRLRRQMQEYGNSFYGVGAYELLQTATEVFLLMECGVRIDSKTVNGVNIFDSQFESNRLERDVTLNDVKAMLTGYLAPGRLPYLDRVIDAAFPQNDRAGARIICEGVLTARANTPCLLELIWSYWHEEGMLVQSLNAITRRFQNLRAPGERDPLSHLELDPLRPLNNIIWGYIQDEQHRLSVKRRAYEYDHHYGLTLIGKAVNHFRPADTRSKFLEAFHNLLHRSSQFFREDNDTTVISDGFPLLNALKEVHLILAQGAHNQFGDLPWTARTEMLIQQWVLGRTEIREFLQSRAMVPYTEAWMPQVDTMKTMQGWSDTTVTQFRDLGVYGEQLLLTVRYGDWIDVNDEDSAKNWARYWRPEIQSYIHAYRAVTGVDLTNPDTIDFTVPGLHLKRRLAAQQRAR